MIPRGLLPSGTVPTTAAVAASMIVRSPEVSLVTYTATAGALMAAAGVDSAGAAAGGSGSAPPQATTAAAATIHIRRVNIMITGAS
jgi:hypothetical protein